MEKEKKLEIDITYNIEKIDSFFDEEKINEFVSYILKDEYKKDFDKSEYYLSLLITTNDGLETTLPTIQVQPILDYEDVLNITSFVKDQTLSTKGVRFSQELEHLLASYIKDSARTQELKNKIQKLVNEELLSTSTEE